MGIRPTRFVLADLPVEEEKTPPLFSVCSASEIRNERKLATAKIVEVNNFTCAFFLAGGLAGRLGAGALSDPESSESLP